MSTEDETTRISRKCAAFDLWLDNIPTLLEPNRGDPEMADRMADIIDEVPGATGKPTDSET